MDMKTVAAAVLEARRFIEAAEAIRWDERLSGYDHPVSTVETAAARRASMELTRSLARMRAPRKW